MPTTVSIEPTKLHKYLQVVEAQRKRAITNFSQQFGADSPAVVGLQADLAELQAGMGDCIKQAASAPHSSTRK